MIEIRFHGRGGQGAVTAAKILAIAASKEGKYSQAFPAFGPERRGAPVQAFCRIDDRPITLRTLIYEPDYVIVLDPSLLTCINTEEGLKAGGKVIVNGEKTCLVNVDLGRTGCFDVNETAMKIIGKPIVNTAMLAVFSKLTDVVGIDSIKEAINEAMPGKVGEKNIELVEAIEKEMSD